MPNTITPDSLGTYLDGVSEKLESPLMQGPLQNWVDELAGDLGKSMTSGTSPVGVPHQTLKNPRSKGHNQSPVPLIDFGDMFQSVIGTGSDHIEEVSNDSVKFGTKDKKAAIHQFGTSVIPARPFIGVNDKMIDRAVELVADEAIRSLDF